MAYAGALLTGLYACLDARDWAGLAPLLTVDARWYVLPSDDDPAGSVRGREAICTWLAGRHAEPVIHEITAVRDEGTCAAVFLAVEQRVDGEARHSRWLDSYRFADGLVAEHVSLRVG